MFLFTWVQTYKILFCFKLSNLKEILKLTIRNMIAVAREYDLEEIQHLLLMVLKWKVM